MMMNDEELVGTFANLFDQVEPEGPQEIDAVLREAGRDPDAIAERVDTMVAEAKENGVYATPLSDDEITVPEYRALEVGYNQLWSIIKELRAGMTGQSESSVAGSNS
jgi:hypothetical protein